MSKLLALVLGVAFIAAGALGYVDNPIVGGPGSGAMFETNAMHNYVHIGSGAVLILGALTFGAKPALLLVGVAYAAVTAAHFFMPPADGMLLGLVHVNENDKWLHAGLTVALLVAAFLPGGGTKAA